MKTTILILLGMLLVACASSGPTPYAPAPENGFGYHEDPLTSNRWRITFEGNSLTRSEKVQDYTLLRAAELTLEQGYDWFRIADRNTDEERRVRGSSSLGVGSIPVIETRCGVVTCTSVYTHSGAGIGTSIHFPMRETTRYTTRIEIVMGNDTPESPDDIYDARETVQTLRGRL